MPLKTKTKINNTYQEDWGRQKPNSIFEILYIYATSSSIQGSFTTFIHHTILDKKKNYLGVPWLGINLYLEQ